MLVFLFILAAVLAMAAMLAAGRRAPLETLRSGWRGPDGTAVRTPEALLRKALRIADVRPPGATPRVRPWTKADREGFAATWRSVCAHFDDDPRAAALYADVLIAALLRRTGLSQADAWPDPAF